LFTNPERRRLKARRWHSGPVCLHWKSMMKTANADRNLLFGILAMQMDL
jgi:hypothetical protein